MRIRDLSYGMDSLFGSMLPYAVSSTLNEPYCLEKYMQNPEHVSRAAEWLTQHGWKPLECCGMAWFGYPVVWYSDSVTMVEAGGRADRAIHEGIYDADDVLGAMSNAVKAMRQIQMGCWPSWAMMIANDLKIELPPFEKVFPPVRRPVTVDLTKLEEWANKPTGGASARRLAARIRRGEFRCE